MQLTSYVTSVRSGVNDAAALADEPTRQVADRLGSVVESATRLALIAALSDATAEISTELAPGSVEVRMNGTEPTFVVTLPEHNAEQPTLLMPESDQEPDPVTVEDDEPQARLSLRLPQSVKAKVDEYADADGVSTNTWLLHRVLEALAQRGGSGRRGGAFSFEMSGKDGGSMRFGPFPPAPPNLPFPPGFPFDADQRRGRRKDRGHHRDRRDGGSGSVQGWVQ